MVNNTVIDWFEPWPEQVQTAGPPSQAALRVRACGSVSACTP